MWETVSETLLVPTGRTNLGTMSDDFLMIFFSKIRKWRKNNIIEFNKSMKQKQELYE